jgi:phosphate transport system substrate-binding protein
MAADACAIGFGPANHAGGRDRAGLWLPGEFVNGEFVNVRPVSLAETDAGPYYDDSFENVLSRAYPLSRSMSLFLNKYPDKPFDRLGREFVRVALSREGQEVVARSIFLPLPASTVRESLARLQ